ncbi:thiamine diphosphokinase [Aestuariibius sp. HNIBRBA575]|uniref:thiamine diphosphokinase n=1 Tax=Aestuariibius sp. HNIBRBA575 TaxID=3233343 RepID=UPI0034A4C0CF
MKSIIVSSESPITLVGGARLNPDDVNEVLSLAPLLVAADGGAASALTLGHLPEAVIGDMDSLPDDAAQALSGRIHCISEQDSTDFDKALRSIDAPLVVALGFAGGRFDHELAVMNTLVRRADRACIVVGAETLVFVAPPKLRLDLSAGSLVSLFPMAEVRANATGLQWPVEDLDLAPDGRVGTSNAATGPVDLSVDTPSLLVILPRSALRVAIMGLLAQRGGAQWPVRAE